jgi:hypothetical protein
MNKFIKTILLALVVVGGLWILVNRDRIRNEGGIGAFAQNRLNSFGNANQNGYHWSQQPNGLNPNNSFVNNTGQPNQPFGYQGGNNAQLAGQNGTQPRGFVQTSSNVRPDNRAQAQFRNLPLNNRLRIASFKLELSASHPNNQQALGILADTCLKFDLIAFQEIDGHSKGWLEDLTQEISRQTQGQAVYQSVSDHTRVARGQPQYAFVFNTQSLELDFNQAYTVADPDRLLKRSPLVGWFRTRAAAANEAFTFTVANIQLDNQRPGDELVYLSDLFRAIRNDGRGEDDIILVGDFAAGDRGLQHIQQRSGLTWVVSNTPTNTLNNAQYDNVVFNQTATMEFTGHGGVVDFLTIYNLSMRDALSISSHMPVWAEFSIFED